MGLFETRSVIRAMERAGLDAIQTGVSLAPGRKLIVGTKAGTGR